ncbi:MAG: hypothetical protein ACKVW3_07880 [Phycisphaerales bacterium]
MRTVALMVAIFVAGLWCERAAAQAPDATPQEPKKEAASAAVPRSMGVPDEITSLRTLIGSWNVAMTYYSPIGQPFKIASEAIIEPTLSGNFLRERLVVPWGPLRIELECTRSFDRFQSVYRFVWFDDFMSLADVFEGTATAGIITVSNVRVGTSSRLPGQPETFLRITQKPGTTNDEYSLVWEASTDDGATWRKTADCAYTRKPEALR